MILAFWFIIWKIIEFQVCWREYKFVGERFVGDNTNKGAKAQHQQRRKKFVGERFVGDNTNKGAVKGLLVTTPTKAQKSSLPTIEEIETELKNSQ